MLPEKATARWERLFADLDGMAADGEWSELTAEVDDRARGEIGRLRMFDRLRAAIGHTIAVRLVVGEPVTGAIADVGPDWLLVADEGRRESLIPAGAVAGIEGLGWLTAVPGGEGRVAARLDLRYVLRRLTKDREPLAVRLISGAVVTGTCDRVGSDYAEIAEHAPGEFRRRDAVRAVLTVPLRSIVLMRPA
ncbi:MAG: hypothetical protein QOJ50_2450 [Cryptosporangiaceae bacterium]|nr:hypothetical protein [Cryptosporangiaceae bacterium]